MSFGIRTTFNKRFCTKVGRVVTYDSKNSATLKMIHENRQRCNLGRRKTVETQFFTEVFRGVQALDLTYVYNDDDALVDWTPVMKSLRSAIESETVASVRRLITGTNRVDAVVIDHPVHEGEMLDTMNVQITLAAGPWVMEILD